MPPTAPRKPARPAPRKVAAKLPAKAREGAAAKPARPTPVVTPTPTVSPVATTPAVMPQVSKPAKPAKVGKSEKQRIKLIRDSFAMPEADFALIAELKGRAVDAKRPAKKSELLRAGLKALASLSPAALVKALDALAPVKTGRPKKGH